MLATLLHSPAHAGACGSGRRRAWRRPRCALGCGRRLEGTQRSGWAQILSQPYHQRKQVAHAGRDEGSDGAGGGPPGSGSTPCGGARRGACAGCGGAGPAGSSGAAGGGWSRLLLTAGAGCCCACCACCPAASWPAAPRAACLLRSPLLLPSPPSTPQVVKLPSAAAATGPASWVQAGATPHYATTAEAKGARGPCWGGGGLARPRIVRGWLLAKYGQQPLPHAVLAPPGFSPNLTSPPCLTTPPFLTVLSPFSFCPPRRRLQAAAG